MTVHSTMEKQVGRLGLACKINSEHHLDGFFGLVVEGVQRVGKSGYIQQALAEAHGKWEMMLLPRHKEECMICVVRGYEAVKKTIVFKPEEFLDTTKS